MKRILIENYKNFDIYELLHSKDKAGQLYVQSDADLEYYLERVKGYCPNLAEAKKQIDMFWERVS